MEALRLNADALAFWLTLTTFPSGAGRQRDPEVRTRAEGSAPPGHSMRYLRHNDLHAQSTL